MEAEQRLSERTNVSVPLRYSIPDLDISGFSWMNDLSSEGLGILTEDLLPEGRRILIRVKLKGEFQPLIFHGVIVWSSVLSSAGGGRHHRAISGIRLDRPDLVSISKIIKK